MLLAGVEDVAQPGVRLLAIGLGGFDQAVDLRAGRGPLGRVAEQPVLALDDEGADGVLGTVSAVIGAASQALQA